MSKFNNTNRKNELDSGLMGIGGLMTFQRHNSASRQVMSTNQVGQSLVTKGNTKRRLITGVEFEYGRFTFKHEMPEEGTIVSVIQKFPTNNIFQENIGKNPRTIIIFETRDDNGERIFDVLDMMSHHKTHPQYGFQYEYNEDLMDDLVPGKPIPKGVVFAKSPAIEDDGSYKYGIDVNVAMMSHPAGIEDGFMISESLRNALTVDAYGERSISVGKSHYLLNIYGDDENYKPFPTIGEYIRPDRLLFASREYNENMAIVDMMPARKGRLAATQTPDWMFDNCIYVEKVAKVIDITVYKNHIRKSNLPTKTTAWMDKWHQLNFNFYQQIINQYYGLTKRFPQGFTISPAFETLLIEAMSFTVQNNRADQLVRTINGQPLDEYSVHVLYQYKYNPIIGAKFTGGAGDKGVTVRITPDDQMPVDAEGNRAHLVVDDFSTIKRMNLGRTYEQEIGACCLAVEKRLKAIVESEGYQKGWEYLSGFYQAAAPEMYKLIQAEGIDKNPKRHIDFVLKDKIYLWFPEHQQKENQQIIEELMEKYPPCYGPVTYTDLEGKVVTTRSPILIGPMYFMLLEKTASTFAATASTRYQHHGILATVQGNDRNTSPARNNPTRSGGESEVRLFLSVMDSEAVAEILEQTNDPNTHAFIVNTIHNSDNPSDIPQVIDRSVVPRGNSRPMQFVNHKFQCFGLKLKYEGNEE